MPRKQDTWIGIVVSPPAVGTPLVIGRPGSRSFRVTSPVTVVVTRADGVLVHTVQSRYLVGIAGNTYLVHTEVASSDEVMASRSTYLLPASRRARANSGVTVSLRRLDTSTDTLALIEPHTASRV